MRTFSSTAQILCFFLLHATISSAQVHVYKTVEDLINNTPKVYEHYEFAGQSGKYKDVVLSFKDRRAKDKVALECTEMWGFSYKDKLFRVVKPNQYYDKKYVNFPVLLSTGTEGGPHLWVVGNALVAQVHKDHELIQLNPYYTSFVSANFISDLILAPIDDLGDAQTKKIMAATRKFVEDNPQLQWFHDCMAEQTEEARERKKDVLRYHLVRNCISNKNRGGYPDKAQ